MTRTEAERLAVVEQRAERAEQDITEIKGDLKAILRTLNEAKGGWRTLFAVAGLAGAVGAGLLKIAALLGLVK
jgi:hypothetical protein